MSIESLLNKANIFDEIDWAFSSSFVWKQIVDDSPSAYHQVRLADQLRLSGMYREAHKVFSRIKLEEIPLKFHYHYFINLGKLYEDQFNLEMAIFNYEKCTKLNIDLTVPYIFLADLLLRKEDLVEAEKVLKLALDKKGDIDEVYFNLSTIYLRKGDLKQALASIKKCLDLDNNFPHAEKVLNDILNLQKLKISANSSP